MAGSALSKISKATPTKGGNNIKDGNYLYYIERVTYDERGYNGATFVAEFRVIEAAANGATDEEKKGMPRGKPVVPNAVGTSCSLVCLLDKFDNAGGNAKAFLLGAMTPLGYTEDDITEDLILQVSSAANPLRGVAVRNETYRGWNKGKSNINNRDMALTLNSWKPVGQSEADITARRAWLDANNATVPVEPAAGAAPATPAPTPDPVPSPAAQPVASSPAPAGPPAGGLLSRLGVSK